MKSRHIASVLFATFCASSFAGPPVPAEYYVGPEPAFVSSKTRAQVEAEYRQAARSGELVLVGEAGIAPADASPVLTRARSEVLADMQIDRESGLAAFRQGEAPDFSSPAFLQAQARYDSMRASPYYATLVRQITARRGEAVNLASH